MEQTRTLNIDGNKMNVSLYGGGPTCIVILSGSGVPFPHLEYSPLTNALSAHYKTILIEKFGYGLSDIVTDVRTMDTVIAEYRAALHQLGIQTPIILAAHSMGFIEALFWAQYYPDEVSGLVGLDPATPACYQEFDVEGALNGLRTLSKDCEIREEYIKATLPGLRDAVALAGGDLHVYEAALKCILANPVWISEAEQLRESIANVSGQAVQVPTLFLVSNGEGTSLTREQWRAHAIHYLQNVEDAEYQLFDYPHNLYKYEPIEMAGAVCRFFASHHVGE